MAVRRRKWVTAEGHVKWAYLVHVVQTLPDGSVREVRKTSPIQTLSAAREHERRIRTELLAGTYGMHTGAPTFETVAGEFLKAIAGRRKRSTVATYSANLRLHILPTFGSRKVGLVDQASIERWVTDFREGRRARTVNLALAVLQRVLRFAQGRGYLRSAPTIERLRRETVEVRYLSFEEVERLIHAARKFGQWHSWIVLALKTGARCGELCAVRWRDLNLDQGTFHIRTGLYAKHEDLPKGNRERVVPLTPACIEALKAHPRFQTARPEHRVFQLVDGSDLTRHAVKNWLISVAKAAGLKPLGSHVLRHTAASHLVLRGVHLLHVRDLLGHADLATTQVYAHLSPSSLADAVKVLG